jgi:PAS domain S-box-containing protein
MFKTLKTFDYHPELIETLLKAKAGAFAANVIAPLLFLFILHNQVPNSILYLLTCLQMITFIIRMVFADKALKILYTADKKRINKYLKYYLSMIFINAFLLGLSSIIAAVYVNELYMIILIAMIFSLTSGAMGTLTSVYHAVFIFVTVTLTTVIFGLLLVGTETLHYAIAFLISLYIIIVVPSAFKVYSSINSNLKQRMEIKALNNFLQHNIVELKEKNSNFQNLLDITMEAIIISDENQKIIDVNQSAVYLFNFKDKSEALGKNIIEFVPKYELSKLQNVMQKETVEPYEIDLKKSYGETFPTLTSGRDMVIDGTKVRISTILDLSQIKQKDQLLIQQSRQAAMGEMIGNIAHQWRQPLNALGLVLQNINLEHQLGTLDDEFMQRSVDKGTKLTQTMSKTIDDFRDFFKPNRQREYFKIVDSIKSSIDLVESSFEHNNIKIKTDLDEHIKLSGHSNEFSQVVLNILSNAKDVLIDRNIKDKEVQISTFQKENNIFIEISDNAGGIPKGVIEKIFEPYFSTKEEGKGTGIGLYMSKTIVEENMDGKLSVRNNDNGAVFTIMIPKTLEDSLC